MDLWLKVQLIVVPLYLWAHLVLNLQVSECIIQIDILLRWSNPHFCSLDYMTRDVTVEKAK